jgi:HEAT repeat protein
LVKLGDKQAVAPLLAKLDDKDEDVRQAVIGALVKLGDKQAVAPLLAKLDDKDEDVRQAVIGALVELGDKQAVAPLLAKLDDQNPANRVSVAAALHALGEPKGTAALKLCLTSEDVELRRTAVRAYARQRDDLDQRLLSRDLDAADPWLDPQGSVADAQVTNASSRLNLTPDQVRSRYEALAVDLNLKLSWKS